MASLRIHPLTPDRWPDLEALFGPRGACGHCWCMYWRQRGPEWKARTGAGNRAALRAVVERGPPPGLLAYVDGVPAGWVQVGPHVGYVRMLASRTRQPEADDAWTINCFYIARAHRGAELMHALIDAAIAYAREHGATRIDAFPVAAAQRTAAAFAFVGTAAAFRKAGFRRRARRSAAGTHSRYVLLIRWADV